MHGPIIQLYDNRLNHWAALSAVVNYTDVLTDLLIISPVAQLTYRVGDVTIIGKTSYRSTI